MTGITPGTFPSTAMGGWYSSVCHSPNKARSFSFFVSDIVLALRERFEKPFTILDRTDEITNDKVSFKCGKCMGHVAPHNNNNNNNRRIIIKTFFNLIGLLSQPDSSCFFQPRISGVEGVYTVPGYTQELYTIKTPTTLYIAATNSACSPKLTSVHYLTHTHAHTYPQKYPSTSSFMRTFIHIHSLAPSQLNPLT